MGASQCSTKGCDDRIPKGARQWCQSQGELAAELLDRVLCCEDLRLKCRSQSPARRLIDEKIDVLFRVQDLNENGVLEEEELVQLNTKVAMLHHGKDINKDEVRAKYQDLFRKELNPSGEPVYLETFREYIHGVLRGIDPDHEAQVMILEQWVVEAALGRTSLSDPEMHSLADVPFLLLKSFDLDPLCDSVLGSNTSTPLQTPCVDPEDISTLDGSEDSASPPSVRRAPGRFGFSDPAPRAPPPSEATNSGKSIGSLGGANFLTSTLLPGPPPRGI